MERRSRIIKSKRKLVKEKIISFSVELKWLFAMNEMNLIFLIRHSFFLDIFEFDKFSNKLMIDNDN